MSSSIAAQPARLDRVPRLNRLFPGKLLTLLLTACLLSTSACGFRLRGQSFLNFDSIYLSTPANSPLSFEMRRLLRGNGVKVSDEMKTAQAVLDIMAEKREESVLSFSSAGTAREIELRYSLQYRVRANSGEELMPPRQLNLRRELLVTAGQVLPQESERQALYRDMQSDAISQIVRQLEYIRMPAANSGNKTP